MRHGLLMLLVVIGLSLTASGHAAQFTDLATTLGIPGATGGGVG